jgi:uncharacterized DUF497 family protein
MQVNFEWDDEKNIKNFIKHRVWFEEAQFAFLDEQRVIAIDKKHSSAVEPRYYCFGKTKKGELTVRFTYRNKKNRIIGAGYWRKVKKAYEKENRIQR